MMGATKNHTACHSPGSASTIANSRTPIERPTKSPAMKLPTSRNVAEDFLMIHSDHENDRRNPEGSLCVGVLRTSYFVRSTATKG